MRSPTLGSMLLLLLAATHAIPEKRGTPPDGPAAAAGKTSQIVAVSGSATTYRFTNSDIAVSCAGRWYVTKESLAIRNLTESPAQVKVWSRGIPGLVFLSGKSNDCCSGSEQFVTISAQPDSSTDVPFRICTRKAPSVKEQGQIFVSAAGLPPEEISIAVETPTRWDSQILTSTITGLSGIALGAVFGFLSFLAQQDYLKRREREKVFRQNLADNADKLLAFFTSDYDDLLGSEKDWNPDRFNDFRSQLYLKGVYGILPPDEMLAFDKLAKSPVTLEQRAKMIRIIQRNFPHFIRRGNEVKR